MNKPGGEAENDEAVSKELNSKSVPGGAEENVEEPKDPNPEEATAPGGETRTEPSDNFSITREEQDLAIFYENLQESQGQEQTLVQKKPPKNLLETIRARNARGLEQEHVYLGPGTMIHVRWPDAFKRGKYKSLGHKMGLYQTHRRSPGFQTS